MRRPWVMVGALVGAVLLLAPECAGAQWLLHPVGAAPVRRASAHREAFATGIAEIRALASRSASRLVPVDARARVPRRRDGFVAGALSVFVPGLGHVYAGEPWRGAAAFLVAEAGFVIALRTEDRYVAGAAGAVGFGTYLYGILDAPAAAERFNRRHASTVIQ